MKNKNHHEEEDEPLMQFNEPAGVYGIMDVLRQGISFNSFLQIVKESLFNMQEWANILHLDARTLQRYKVSNLTFAPLQSEKILEIKLLNKLGADVFGNTTHFNAWLRAPNIAMGGVVPTNLLDNTFGIGLIKDELIRIQYGVLA